MHVGGKGMPQHVRRHPLRAGQSCGYGSLLDLEQSRLAGQGLGAIAHRMEQPGGGGSAGIGAGQPLPEGDGFDRPLMQRHEPLFVAFATHQQHAGAGRRGIRRAATAPR